MKEVHSTHDLAPNMTIKTEGGSLVQVFSVRHFNDTVSVGISRSEPMLISFSEVAGIAEA
jgi:hypothetical protein